MLLCVYEHAVQTVIIEDAVVDAFCGGALVIDLLISIRAAGDIGVKIFTLYTHRTALVQQSSISYPTHF